MGHRSNRYYLLFVTMLCLLLSASTLFIVFVCALFIIVVVSVYRMVTAYPTYDEMWSYNYYTDHPFYYSFFTYNNYPLFELSTHLFKGLPLPMKVNLRLSPLMAGICACI